MEESRKNIIYHGWILYPSDCKIQDTIIEWDTINKRIDFVFENPENQDYDDEEDIV
jgi:hypothetical protein